jgi:ribokinase
MTTNITVIGSINMDLVTSTQVMPKMGETVLGQSFHTIPGGKGANQAVAATRLGAKVTMIGCVGEDLFGKQLIDHLTDQGVFTDYVEPVTQSETGIASITLANGDNSIIVVSGANKCVSSQLIEKYEDVIAKSDLLLLQLEIPIEAVEKAVEIAKKYNVSVILNPAPIRPLSKKLLQQVDYLTPNEHEQEMLLDSCNWNEEELAMIKKKCIVTKGSKGVTFFENGEKKIPSFKVDVVDTTGAGDSFNGALAIAICEGKSLSDACVFACAVGALAVTKFGAKSGMPTKSEVEHFLNKQEGRDK